MDVQGPCEGVLASLRGSMLDSPGSSSSQGRLTAVKGAEDNGSPSACPTQATLSGALAYGGRTTHTINVGCGALLETAEEPVTAKKQVATPPNHTRILFPCK